MNRKVTRRRIYPLFFFLPALLISSYTLHVNQGSLPKRTAPQETEAGWTFLAVEDVQVEDAFGHTAVIQGDILAVSATGVAAGAGITENRTGLGPEGRNAGAIYLFERQETGWSEPLILMAADAQPGDFFGLSLALSGDVLAVGAPYKKVAPGGMAAGAVYVFQRQGEAWTQQARLAAPDGAPFDLFGNALALQGDLLAVGARSADHPQAGRNAGAVYLYRKEGAEWTLREKLVAGDAGETEYFGQNVILYEDTLLVSAPGHDDRAGGRNAGAVYIFRPRGQTWRQAGRLDLPDPRPEAQFGQSFAINPATGTLAVAALQERGELPEDYPTMLFSPPGVTYVYERRGSGWRHQASLTSSRAMDFNFLLFAGGGVAVGGNPQSGEIIASGMVGFFQRLGTEWLETPYEEFVPPALPGSGMMYFSGLLLAMSEDTVVFGGIPYVDETTTGYLALRAVK